jgi:hypothetical protein
MVYLAPATATCELPAFPMLMAAGLSLFGVLVCLGYGSLVVRLIESWRPGLSRTFTPGDAGLFGYAVLGVLAIVVNFAVPISPGVAGAVCVGGAALLLVHLPRLAASSNSFGWRPIAAGLLLATFCLYLGSVVAASGTSHYDTGLYHIQAIRQIMEYPVIFGVANINMRLGYNSLVFPAAALLSGGVFDLPGAFINNAVLMAFVALGVVFRGLAEPAERCARSTIFGVLLIFVAVFTPILSFRAWAGTPNTDIPSGLIVFYAFYVALHFSDLPEDGGPLLLAFLAAFAITLKLTALPIVLILALPLLAWKRRLVRLSVLTPGLAVMLVLGLPWLAHGIATSGCLAYPQPASCLPVPWRISPAVAQSDLDWMRSWARQPGVEPSIVLADWSWLHGWIASLGREASKPVFIALAAIAAVLALARLSFRAIVTPIDTLSAAQKVDAVLLAAIAVAGILFWFFSAPLVRYGQGWIVVPLLLLIAHVAPIGIRRVVLYANVVRMLSRRGTKTAAAVLLAALVVLGPLRRPAAVLGQRDYARLPDVPVRPQGIHAGIPVYTPVQGNQCWDAPRFCTPHLKEGLVFQPLRWTWMVSDPS